MPVFCVLQVLVFPSDAAGVPVGLGWFQSSQDSSAALGMTKPLKMRLKAAATREISRSEDSARNDGPAQSKMPALQRGDALKRTLTTPKKKTDSSGLPAADRQTLPSE